MQRQHRQNSHHHRLAAAAAAAEEAQKHALDPSTSNPFHNEPYKPHKTGSVQQVVYRPLNGRLLEQNAGAPASSGCLHKDGKRRRWSSDRRFEVSLLPYRPC